MEWWAWLIIFWAVFACGAGCRRGLHSRRRREGHRIRGEESPHAGQIQARTHGVSVEPPLPPAAAQRTPTVAAATAAPARESVEVLSRGEPPQREAPFERLRREFVEGVITVEEYERAIDQMDPRELR